MNIFRVLILSALLPLLYACGGGGGGGGGDSSPPQKNDPDPTASISVSPSSIDEGDSVEISWSSSDADSCSGTGFNTNGATSGNAQVSPVSDTTYSVDCDGATDSVSVTVTPLPEPTITAEPRSLVLGESATLSWENAPAEKCSAQGFELNGKPSDKMAVTPQKTTTYAVDCGEENQAEVTVEVTDPDADKDGVNDDADNCPNVANTNQADMDGDGIGDVCDSDKDGDGVPNDEDAFPEDPEESGDCDKDGVGDSVDDDFCITYIETTPRAVFADKLASTPVTLKVSYKGDVPLSAGWTKSRSSPPVSVSEPLYDDGTHGDEIADDGIWSLMITDKENLPLLRLYDNSVDFFEIIVRATDEENNSVFPNGNRTIFRYVVVVERQPPVEVTCITGTPACYSDWNINVRQDEMDVGKTLKVVYENFRDDFWGITISWNGKTPDRIPNSTASVVKNDVRGIGEAIFANQASHGTVVGEALEIIMSHTPIDPTLRSFNHEAMHRWGVGLNNPDFDLTIGAGDPAHYGTSDVIDPLTKGFFLEDQGSGCYEAKALFDTQNTYFSDISLYLAGFIGIDQVGSHAFLANRDLAVNVGDTICEPDVVVYSGEQIVAFYGARVPSAEESRKEFPFGFVFATPNEPSQAEWVLYKTIAQHVASNKDSNGVVDDNGFKIVDRPSFSQATSRVTGESVGSVVIVKPEPL